MGRGSVGRRERGRGCRQSEEREGEKKRAKKFTCRVQKGSGESGRGGGGRGRCGRRGSGREVAKCSPCLRDAPVASLGLSSLMQRPVPPVVTHSVMLGLVSQFRRASSWPGVGLPHDTMAAIGRRPTNYMTHGTACLSVLLSIVYI